MSKNTPHEEFDDERDAAALEYLIEAGFDRSCIERLPAALRANAERLLGELDAIDRYPVEPPSELLVEATLARVARADEHSRERWRLPQWNAPRSRWGLPNLVAIAALLIVAAGVHSRHSTGASIPFPVALCKQSAWPWRRTRGLRSGSSRHAAHDGWACQLPRRTKRARAIDG